MTPASRFYVDKRSFVPVFLGIWAAAFGLARDLGPGSLVIAPALVGVLAWWTILAPERWFALFFCSCCCRRCLFRSGTRVCMLRRGGIARAGGRVFSGSTEWGGNRGGVLPLMWYCFSRS